MIEIRSCLLLFAMVPGLSLDAGAANGKDAFYWNAQLGRGVNLGNALDAPEEGAWGVVLEASYFRMIAQAGFDSVRIPVRWSAHAHAEAPFTIDPSFFARVDWTVQQALSNDLAVVLNIHHYEELTREPETHRDRFLGLWKQIAERYRDYPDALLLEILNEPCRKLTSELWNDYAAEAVRVIRASNPARTLVLGPAGWNNFRQLENLRLPEDDGRIIVTFHYYDPFHFTHQGAGWVGDQSKAWLGTQWTGADKERAEVAEHLDQAAAWAKAHGVPLYMGEFGAYEKADMASRAKWTAYLREAAERRDISWAYWEFCAGFGVFDAETGTWRKPLRDALVPSPAAISAWCTQARPTGDGGPYLAKDEVSFDEMTAYHPSRWHVQNRVQLILHSGGPAQGSPPAKTRRRKERNKVDRLHANPSSRTSNRRFARYPLRVDSGGRACDYDRRSEGFGRPPIVFSRSFSPIPAEPRAQGEGFE